MIIATAGHIDHGKTALVAALTGIDTDRLAEEKRRGMSIDLGFAYHRLDDGTVLGFVDVPGHEKFVRTMVAGVAGVDFALLVVAADDGVMLQTEEHIDILDLIGIGHGAVAITKADMADEERVAQVSAEVRSRLAPTRLAGAPVFAVSSVTGAGIAPLRDRIEEAARAFTSRPARGHFRLAVDRAFTMAGAGLVVTGTVYSGRCASGEALVLTPSGIPARVRGLRVNNAEAAAASAGARAAVNIAGAGLSKDAVRRGDWLVAPGAHAPTARLDGRLRVARSERRVFANWTPVHLHIGAEDVPARIAVLDGPSIAAGKDGLVRIALDRPVGALAGDRFIVRDQSARRTIAGGAVIDPFPPPRGRARPARLAQLAALETLEDAAALAALLEVSPAGVDLTAFAAARNLTPGEAERAISPAVTVRHGDAAIDAGHFTTLKDRIVATMAEFHRARPDRLGPDLAAVRRAVGGGAAPVLVAGAIGDLAATGALAMRGALIHLAGHEPRLAAGDEAVWAAAAPVLAAGGLAPPVVHEIAKAIDRRPETVAGVLRRAEAIGLVVRIGRNRFAAPETVEQLSRAARSLAQAGELTPARFREAAGIGRNLAVEVLEHFDRVGLTRRDGDRRLLVEPPAARAAHRARAP